MVVYELEDYFEIIGVNRQILVGTSGRVDPSSDKTFGLVFVVVCMDT